MISAPSPQSPPALLKTEADLTALLRTHGPSIRGLLVKRFLGLLRDADLEDVLVIALHSVWRHREKFDPARGSLRAWFYRVADYAAQDLLKHGWQKSRQLEVVPDENFWRQTQSQPPVRTPAVHPATRELVHDVMNELPEVQRRILWADALCPDGGPANSEWLAAELGIPAGTVRVYRKRGLEKLRALFSARGINPN